ncbi:MAG: carboxypeptidase regulatory-like domain-containing protein [Novosphingobium sp.]|uniref:carboxypeptidase-like regulatory domain-containing protein n=1 Tax=Novosphingobium sp. TaxID=1874826 RepID=UPI002619496B|nr:carboxypeptidase-like regulatory domain-containing protein [Novosphingobium sp.]MCP5386265.1 carboxypeptidase regulatory-like domain-containing protein [Novosphingobium sp.]
MSRDRAERPILPICAGSVIAGATILLAGDRPPERTVSRTAAKIKPEPGRQSVDGLPEPVFGSFRTMSPVSSGLPDYERQSVEASSLQRARLTQSTNGLALAASAPIPLSDTAFATSSPLNDGGLPAPDFGDPGQSPDANSQSLALPIIGVVRVADHELIAPAVPTEEAGSELTTTAGVDPALSVTQEELPLAELVASELPQVQDQFVPAAPVASAAIEPAALPTAPSAAPTAVPTIKQIQLATPSSQSEAVRTESAITKPVVVDAPLDRRVLANVSDPDPGQAALVHEAVRPQSPTIAKTYIPQTSKLGEGPGKRTYPVSDNAPLFTYDDELILEVSVAGYPGGDTVIAYGTFDAVYLPLGTLARILDLAINVSDDGHYASGWFLDESRTLTINLRQSEASVARRSVSLHASDALAFDGELYLRAEKFSEFLPLTMTPDLRNQSVKIATLEPFPFEERLKREADRERLASRASNQEVQRWPREETPWLALSIPTGDIEFRAMSDTARGSRMEGDLRLAGDFAFMSAQAFLGASSDEGLINAHIELGRRDPDADLLGPLQATEFQMGDVATLSMPIGLRGISGRGAAITNTPIESLSVFETVDLRGNLPDGFEVELYRNGVLIDSTRTPVNGQYEFTQVSLDFGINVFRLVFHGPQGQRREEVRRFSVGDGRLPKGKLVYQFGMAQKDVNLLGIRGPNFSPGQDYGAWRATGQVSYGLTEGITANVAGAWFESGETRRWMGIAGVRTGLAGFALKADIGLSENGAKAAEVGIGGKFLGASFTLSHAEYSGEFVDESRGLAGDFLKRASEFDANFNISFGSGPEGNLLPISARARYFEFRNGRKQISANLRGSVRMFGAVLSNTLDYNSNSGSGGSSFSQLVGNFDLATLNRKKTQARLSLGYGIVPDLELVSTSIEIDHAIDDLTFVNASIGHGFKDKDTQFGLSAIRQFERFTVAVDGRYGLKRGTHAFVLRLGTSFGRDPLSGRFFLGEPGQAYSGAASIRAFQDLDGDRIYGDGDILLPEVEFASSSRTARTNEDGVARLGGLGAGNRASIQVDPSTLPDIFMAPFTRGIEVVPRPGRTHVTDFPIVGLSDVEGAVYFNRDGRTRGVAGVSIRLLDEHEDVFRFVRTEADGYYFFEEIPPGEYSLAIDPEQAKRLGICLDATEWVVVPFQSDRIARDLTIAECN